MKILPLIAILLSILLPTITAQSWIETNKMVASDRANDDYFGFSNVLGDNQLFIGAFSNEGGCVYVFDKVGSGWIESYKLLPSDPQSFEGFGKRIILDNDNLVISNQEKEGSVLFRTGAVYIFNKNIDGIWTEQQKLEAQNPIQYGNFGIETGIDNHTLAVGTEIGNVNVFEFNINTNSWEFEQELNSSDGITYHAAVAVKGDRIVVGSYDYDEGGQSNTGAAYIFEKNIITGNWQQIQKILSPEIFPEQRFGKDLFFYDDFLFISAPSVQKVYVYRHNASTYQYEYLQKLSGESAFGQSVAAENGTLVIGANQANLDASNSNSVADAGAVYVYKLSNNLWNFSQKLVHSDRDRINWLGSSVSIRDAKILAGAPYQDKDVNNSNHVEKAGAAYTFEPEFTQTATGIDSQVACDSYTWVDGNTYVYTNNSALFNFVGGASDGSDSIVRLDLTILNPALKIDTQNQCNAFTWINGITYTSSNNTATFNYPGAAANGCDSIVKLDLTITGTATGIDIQSACYTYNWIDGNTYTSNNNSATINIPGGSVNGCDSVVTLNLTINDVATFTDTQSACDSYTWIDGNTYFSDNNSATYSVPGGSIEGCDSIITLDLSIQNTATGIDSRSECNSYTWIDGNTYTSDNNSATYTIPGGAANGCDSMVTLDLTIYETATGIDTQFACYSLTWIDDNFYFADNNFATYTFPGGASNGCDSIVTLNLTLYGDAMGTDTRIECDSYTWINGNTYTSDNNSATFRIYDASINGCDSIVHLDLTIETVNTTVNIVDDVISSEAEGAIYQWLDCDNSMAIIPGANEQSFMPTTSGNYAVAVTDGCTDTSACVLVNTVGLIENVLDEKYRLYPNPTSGIIAIDFEEMQEYLAIKVFSIIGQEISFDTVIKAKHAQFKIESPAGLYMLELSDGSGKKAMVKIIKN